jgi:hypothetical protein
MKLAPLPDKPVQQESHSYSCRRQTPCKKIDAGAKDHKIQKYEYVRQGQPAKAKAAPEQQALLGSRVLRKEQNRA